MSRYQPRHAVGTTRVDIAPLEIAPLEVAPVETARSDRRTVLRLGAATVAVGATALAAPSVAGAASRPTLKLGSRGWQVKSLQTKLRANGYWCKGANGVYDSSTQQAVMALQKMRGLSRDGVCGPNTWKAVDTIYRPVSRTRSGNIMEINKGRQVILFVRAGKVKWVFNTSTGNGERYWSSASGRYLYATTPSGRFAFQRAIDGMRRAPLGNLWRPRYFNGGIAIHGSPSIPGYPASHGCARLDNKAIDYIWSANLAPIGSRVWVY
ncbi:L,D-transpeptidase family protein [Janibacter melonis]|uniref:L,D-transpeptidase family protein n=1 Tax=Janibacter melonis TaxID=262209 RepID=UPI001E56C302|nr:L,D-transpeptidase family protein [Janibacter melonis]MCB5990934.1 L,D-transpeptidase family protein [Janibacter melonis]